MCLSRACVPAGRRCKAKGAACQNFYNGCKNLDTPPPWRVRAARLAARVCQPTLPSSETLRSFWASTANSIGSLFITSLA